MIKYLTKLFKAMQNVEETMTIRISYDYAMDWEISFYWGAANMGHCTYNTNLDLACIDMIVFLRDLCANESNLKDIPYNLKT